MSEGWLYVSCCAMLFPVGLFASNLRHLLLTPPLSQYLDRDSDSDTVTAPHAPVSSSHSSSTLIVCGVDPGFAHGHKVSVVIQIDKNMAHSNNH